MSNFEYNVDDRFETQNAIRTLHFSFKPHLPFTAAYEMALQNAGGGELVSDPAKENYFRVGAKDMPGSTNPDSLVNDSKYPWKAGHPLSRRDIYRGTGSGKLTKMAESQNREENVLGVQPDTKSATTEAGRQLANLLSVDYKTGKPIYTPQSSRDKAEMELKMIAEGFDKIAGTKGGRGQQLNRDFDPTYTDRTGGGFDVDLTKYATLSDYVESIAGGRFNDMEITKSENKILGKFKGADKVTKTNKTKWEDHIDKTFTRYNAHIREMYALNEEPLEGGFMPTTVLREGEAFDYARLITTTGGDTNTLGDNYNIRQILDRFARNNMKPYLFQTQLADDRWGLLTIGPIINNAGIPQFERKGTEVITTSASLQAGYTEYLKNIDGISKKTVTAEVTKVKRVINQNLVLTEARIETLDKYAQARVTLDTLNQITTELDIRGTDQVHKIQNTVAKKMLDDIYSYFNSNNMQASFAEFYDKLIRASNDLTKDWFKNSSKLTGNVTGQPLSTEFMYGKAWNGPLKKYLGVWNSPDEDTWKTGGTGHNFSIAPLLESRRALSSNLNVNKSY